LDWETTPCQSFSSQHMRCVIAAAALSLTASNPLFDDGVSLLQRRVRKSDDLITEGQHGVVDDVAINLMELRSLCEGAGLTSACAALDKKVPVPDRTLALLESPWWETRQFSPNGSLPEGGCLPPGALIFVHVMKTGGIAVNELLTCRCQLEGCAVHMSDLHLDAYGYGQCEPSVCSMHAQESSASSVCGSSFADARRFTVLREPVERVWSFFNYLRRWYRPFQERSLTSILENYGEDLNAALNETERQCTFCRQELANAMVVRSFSSAHEDAGSRPLSRSELSLALEEAKRTLRSMDAVFLFADLGRFPELFGSVPELFPTRRRGSPAASSAIGDCRWSRQNPSNYSQQWPDLHLEELIEERNWADVELYNYALTLPNLVRPAVAPN